MDFLENSIVLISVIIIVEAIKKIMSEDIKRYLPLIAIGVGVVLNTLFAYFTHGLTADAVLQGVIIGGASSGIYDLKKKTILNK